MPQSKVIVPRVRHRRKRNNVYLESLDLEIDVRRGRIETALETDSYCIGGCLIPEVKRSVRIQPCPTAETEPAQEVVIGLKVVGEFGHQNPIVLPQA
jgi:hypothetical protein